MPLPSPTASRCMWSWSMALSPPKDLERPLISRMATSAGLGLGGLPFLVSPKPGVLAQLLLVQLLRSPAAGDEPLRPLEHHEDEQGAVDQEPVLLKLPKDLGQRHQDQGSEDDAGHAGQTADDDDGEHGDGHEHLEGMREHRAHLCGEERTTEAG